MNNTKIMIAGAALGIAGIAGIAKMSVDSQWPAVKAAQQTIKDNETVVVTGCGYLSGTYNTRSPEFAKVEYELVWSEGSEKAISFAERMMATGAPFVGKGNCKLIAG